MNVDVDKEIYSKAHNKSHRWILQKKRVLWKKKKKENFAKPNDLWKTLKLLVLSKHFSFAQTNAIEDNKRLKYDLKSVAQTFAKFSSNLAESLLKNSPNKFDMNSIHQY